VYAELTQSEVITWEKAKMVSSPPRPSKVNWARLFPLRAGKVALEGTTLPPSKTQLPSSSSKEGSATAISEQTGR